MIYLRFQDKHFGVENGVNLDSALLVEKMQVDTHCVWNIVKLRMKDVLR